MQKIVYDDNNNDGTDDEKVFLWYSSSWKVHQSSQSAFTCSKLTIETVEQCVKYVQI